MQRAQSALAVVAGIAFIIITHNLTDLLFHLAGIFPWEHLNETWMAATALGYRIVFQVAGAYLCARLAPSRSMLHALILGVIGLVFGTAAAALAIPLDLSPVWYPVALAASALPAAWFGGKLYLLSKEANISE